MKLFLPFWLCVILTCATSFCATRSAVLISEQSLREKAFDLYRRHIRTMQAIPYALAQCDRPGTTCLTFM